MSNDDVQQIGAFGGGSPRKYYQMGYTDLYIGVACL